MAELEKVIEHLKEIAEYFRECRNNASFASKAENHFWELQNAASEAAELLKAQEPVAPEEYTVIVSQYGNAEHKCYRCGACKCGLIRNANWRQKYCPECGRAVKWAEPPKEET